jgi:hypothetical protein
MQIQEFVNKGYELMGHEPKPMNSLPTFGPKVFGTISKIIPLNVLKLLGEINELKYMFLIDFTVNSSKFEQEFG